MGTVTAFIITCLALLCCLFCIDASFMKHDTHTAIVLATSHADDRYIHSINTDGQYSGGYVPPVNKVFCKVDNEVIEVDAKIKDVFTLQKGDTITIKQNIGFITNLTWGYSIVK